MDIESVPGVGEKTADALSELEDPERALRTGDVATLTRAPGISDGRAARIARGAVRQRHDDPGGFAATARAQEVYREALKLVQQRTVTAYAERRLETFYPSPTASRIAEAREFARRALERDPDEGVRGALAGVEPLAEPGDVRVRDRCLATTDAETYARAQEAVPEVTVEIVDDARGLADLARGYATVIALDEAFAGIEVEGDVRVDPDALAHPERVVPERTLSFFAHNRQRLRAAVEVHRASDLEPPCDPDELAGALGSIGDDGSVWAATEGSRGVLRFHGGDWTGVDSLLERELADEYAEAVAAAREHLCETVGLDEYADIARRAFPDDPTFPVERDESVVARLREELTTARDRRATERKRELAADLADARPAAERLVSAALELDVELAVARFAREFDCTMPDFGGSGVAIEGGRSPLLDVPQSEVEPVDYEVAGVALLTGVNSGGKTSTLDLVALVVTLAHMGLPVPADYARVGRVSALHYHAKTQGTLDAGAFESTLREFGSLVEAVRESAATDEDVRRSLKGEDGDVDETVTGVDGTARVDDPHDIESGRNAAVDAGLRDHGPGGLLVLVDELESITEPGASAKIMAGILEAFADSDATAVFVTHLAREIRDAARVELAVDGIEAAGLVDGELRVDRSPVKGKLARSTPELIVEKLADERDGFYDDLLGKFE
ncbi:DNA mismatch repair protein MutS [Halobacteriales archaeon SW_7_68_16]|nr:MAG: DNA mismatch repair protein MutS [Halobacteriales archaeon SW_7_68_16]